MNFLTRQRDEAESDDLLSSREVEQEVLDNLDRKSPRVMI